ncbi:MAG: NADH-quinone oxidoreductase subunit 1 [Turneriella sp.]|nr:NADH-quinone oxidoreductase subunit 1 [Turneriella sp.]
MHPAKARPAHPKEHRVVLSYFHKENSYTLEGYEAEGGYATLKRLIRDEKEKWTPDAIIDEVKRSNLRGRGGAGFPTGMKWSFVPKDSPEPKYVVCNADESEPGTFKDRFMVEEIPHSIIEGMVIAALALNSEQGYIYLRGEFYKGWERIEAALKEAYAKGYLGDNILGTGRKFHLATYRGAGAYICGEETALLESLEGKRGHPRLKPPFPAFKGLYASPTVVNNVETFATVPAVFRMGAEAYAKLCKGNEKSGGTKVFSISGHVQNPGVYEFPLGLPLSEVIEIAGGLRPGRTLKAVIPGGSSTPILTPEEVEKAVLDYEGISAVGSMLGSGGLMVLDDTTDLVELTYRVAHFYGHESCGQCTPCREGSRWMSDIMHRVRDNKAIEEDILTMLSFTTNMVGGTTICPFSDAAVMAVTPIIKKFRPEFDARLNAAGINAR